MLKVIGFVLCLLGFVGGIVVMAYSFVDTGFDGVIFVAGLLLSTLMLFIPVSVVRWLDRA